MTPVEQVPARAWKEWADANDAVIVDVREPAEWAMGTLPDSERISLMTLPHRLDAFDKSRAVLVVCRTGSRSNQAAQYLAGSGFRSVANLAGGLAALGLAA